MSNPIGYISIAQFNLIKGCIDYALSNPDCSLAWLYEDAINNEEHAWLIEELKDLSSLINKVTDEEIVTITTDALISSDIANVCTAFTSLCFESAGVVQPCVLTTEAQAKQNMPCDTYGMVACTESCSRYVKCRHPEWERQDKEYVHAKNVKYCPICDQEDCECEDNMEDFTD